MKGRLLWGLRREKLNWEMRVESCLSMSRKLKFNKVMKLRNGCKLSLFRSLVIYFNNKSL